MERKVIVKEELASPRVDPLDEEDVFDYPGLEDVSSGTGPVPRDAHIALKEAFESLKKRFLEAQAQIAELKAKLKRDRKGSHERVYRERDELLSHLQKSYLAFKEKYGENEQLKKMIQELKESLKLSQEAAAQGEVAAQPGPSSEEEDKLEKKRYTTIMEELKTIGLEVIEENGQMFIMLTDRDNLNKWIEEKTDGNLTIEIKGSTSEDKAVETEAVITRQEGYEQAEGKRKRVEAEVIFLKQKIEDQAQELNRFYKIFKEVMTRNKILSAREQRKEVEGGNAEGPPISKPSEAAAKRTSAQKSAAFQKKAETILSSTQEQVVEMKQVKEHLDKQHKSLHALMGLTDKTTKDFKALISAPKARQDVADSPGGRNPRWPEEAEGGAMSFSQGQTYREEGSFERVLADDAPLSIPVQESELHRLKRSGEAGEVIYGQRLSGEINLSPSSSVLSRGAEGRAVAMTTFLSENTGTGESDIEVIEEEEDFIGATPSRGKICPICERFFPDSYGQEEFELHVNQHFAE